MHTDMHVQTCLCVYKCVKECNIEGGKAVPLECPLSLITSDYRLLERVDQPCAAPELMTQTNAFFSHSRHIHSVISLLFFPGDLTKLTDLSLLFNVCSFPPKHCSSLRVLIHIKRCIDSFGGRWSKRGKINVCFLSGLTAA